LAVGLQLVRQTTEAPGELNRAGRHGGCR
jgi:hypothetical protein